MSSNIGLIGLGVMGQNFVLNILDKGFGVSVYNRTFEKTQSFLDEHPGRTTLLGFEELKDFVESLEKPRKIILLIKAGKPVDLTVEALIPLLDSEDIIIDLGNANWKGTIKRQEELAKHGIHFIGSGVSGGEEGARHGPSLMPGGDESAYQEIRPIWDATAAKDFDGNPCSTYVGSGPAGNFVKMVHNGIEYAMMQAIAEIYDIYRNTGHSNEEIYEVFKELNSGLLKSYLLEITETIFTVRDDQDTDGYLIDKILDTAKSKGTGRWTVEAALELGVPTPAITDAMIARQMSAREWSFAFQGAGETNEISKKEVPLESTRNTLTLVYLVSYLQGLQLIKTANEEFDWGIDLNEVTRIWQGGCIIRSDMLRLLPNFFSQEESKEYSELQAKIPEMLNSIGEVLDLAHVPIPVIGSVRDYTLAIQAKKLPTNLTQAQRDFFGAHTYKRTDMDGTFHTDWINEN